MACDAATLVSDSKCLVQGMSDRQLLASIVYTLATLASIDPTPATLVPLTRCLVQELSEKQLLAAAVYLQCRLNGG